MFTYLERQDAGEFTTNRTGETNTNSDGFTQGISTGPFSGSTTHARSGTVSGVTATGTVETTESGVTEITFTFETTQGENVGEIGTDGEVKLSTITVTLNSESSAETILSGVSITQGTMAFNTGDSAQQFESIDNNGATGGTTVVASFLTVDDSGFARISESSTSNTETDSFSAMTEAGDTTTVVTFSISALMTSTVTLEGEIVVFSTTETTTSTTHESGGFATTNSSIGTTVLSSATASYTFVTFDTDTDHTTVSTSIDLTTIELSVGITDQYVWNTVFVDDGVSDAWVIVSGSTHGVLTDVAQQISVDSTVLFAPFGATSAYPLATVATGTGGDTGESGTVVTSATITFETTTENGSPMRGARQQWIGAGDPPSDTRETVTTTMSSLLTGESTTSTGGASLATYVTATDLSAASFSTSVVTTVTDTRTDAPVFAEDGAQSFTVTTTVTTVLFSNETITISNEYPLTIPAGGGPGIDGGVTLSSPDFPQAIDYRAAQFAPARFAAVAPPGFAAFGDISSAGQTLYRDISAELLSTDSANLLAESAFNALSFKPWGILQLHPGMDFGVGFAEQSHLTRLITLTDVFPLSVYSSTTTSTIFSTDPTTARTLFAMGSASMLSTEGSAITLALTIPHTTTRDTSASTQPSTLQTSAFGTLAFRLGLGIAQSENQPWRQYYNSPQGGLPVDAGRGDILQYFGVELKRTANGTNGSSTTSKTAHFDFATESLSAHGALIFEQTAPILEVNGGGGALQISQFPRFYIGETNPAF